MKRFLYLFQVDKELPKELEEAGGPDSDIAFLTYAGKSSDPRSVYYPSSSWTQGRNRLFKEVSGRPYLYFIFADSDVHLEFTRAGSRSAEPSESPWRAFERFLIEHEPAVGVPAYFWHLSGAWDRSRAVQTLRFFDPVLNAFHRDALHSLLPYYDLMDHFSTDYSGSFVSSIAAELYPGHVLQTNHVRVLNPLSLRAYTERIMSKPETHYLESLRDPQEARSYRRQPTWDRLTHTDMGPRPPKPASYVVSKEELARRYDLDHPLWQRKRELVEMPQDADFWSESSETERAAVWRRINPGSIESPDTALSALITATRPLRVRLGLVRTGRLFATVARLRRLRYEAAMLLGRWRRRLSRPTADRLWREWLADGSRIFDFGTEPESKLYELLAYVCNRLDDAEILFVDVGTGQGEVLAGFEHRTVTTKPVISVGVDPVQTNGFNWYVAYVLGRVVEGGLSLSTLLRQYGLGGRTLHYVRIAVGEAHTAYQTLSDHEGGCLFLTVRAPCDEGSSVDVGGAPWSEARSRWEERGFRLLNLAVVVNDQAVDATFVNDAVLGELVSDLTRADR